MNHGACRNAEGDLHATPFSVQFGKKDIWLPRYGTPKSISEKLSFVVFVLLLVHFGGVAWSYKKDWAELVRHSAYIGEDHIGAMSLLVLFFICHAYPRGERAQK
jgi:hypothetical protein